MAAGKTPPAYLAPCVPVSPPRALMVTSIFLMFCV